MLVHGRPLVYRNDAFGRWWAFVKHALYIACGHVAGLALVALAVLLFLMNLRRLGEDAGRAAEWLEQLERTNAIQRQMLDAAVRHPRDRDDLVERLRGKRF